MSSVVLSHSNAADPPAWRGEDGPSGAVPVGHAVRSVKHLPGLLAWARSGNELWCTSRRRVVAYDLKSGDCRDVVALPGGLGRSMLPLSTRVARLLRRGVRTCSRLTEGGLLVFGDNHSYYWPADKSEPVLLGRVAQGHGPLVQGCCQDDSGVCFYGDYWGNPDRKPVRIWRWKPGQAGWREYYRFPAGAVRHIHAVQFDRFSGRIWVATGDRDEESKIGFLRETRHGPELEVVAAGWQGTRAVSLMFTPMHVTWGTDAGRDTDESCNFVFRWSRASRQFERIAPVGGPVYYSTVDERGRMFLTTAVEGSCSETDRRMRLWTSEQGDTWQELMSWEKDRYPLKLGYGVLWFPQDGANDNTLCVSGQGVTGGPGTWILEV